MTTSRGIDPTGGLPTLLLRLKERARSLRAGSSVVGRAGGLLLSALYRGAALYLVGMDIPTTTPIGRGVVVHHGVGLVVTARSRIDDRVVLRQNTTIGSRDRGEDGPHLAEGVNVGANVVILGAIRVGVGATIGAGSVVIDDVPDGATVVGNPARRIR